LKCLYFAPQLSMKFPVAGALASSSQIQTQPNPPNFPPSVQVFTSLTPTDLIDSKIQAAFAENGGSPPQVATTVNSLTADTPSSSPQGTTRMMFLLAFTQAFMVLENHHTKLSLRVTGEFTRKRAVVLSMLAPSRRSGDPLRTSTPTLLTSGLLVLG